MKEVKTGAAARAEATATTESLPAGLNLPGLDSIKAMEPNEEVSKLAKRTIGGVWTPEQVREGFRIWQGADAQRYQIVNLMAQAYQAKLISLTNLNAVYLLNRKSDAGGRFLAEFRTECRMLGSGGSDSTHYLTVQKGRGKFEGSIVEFDAAKDRGGTKDKLSGVLNKVGRYAATAFKTGGADAVQKFGAQVEKILHEVAEDGSFKVRK
ncbi:MAG: hypothetical protein ACREBU_02455 [Nitrososphaera sp.]